MRSIFNLRVMLVLALLGVAAAAGWWLRERIHAGMAPQPETQAQTVPDYYMENFTVHAMNEAGQPRYQLTAAKMVHYAEDDHSDLTKPHALFFRPAGPPYVLDSPRGQVLQGGEQVDLLGQVEIDRIAGEKNRPLHVTTRDARVFPARNYAESDTFTVITSERSHMQGVGMRAWFDERRLQLLSQVKGIYDVKKR